MATDQISAADRLLHDALLDMVPDHPADCAICAIPAATDEETPPVTTEPKTFSEAEHTAAVEAAVKAALEQKLPDAIDAATKPLKEQLAKFETDEQAEAHKAELAELQGKLDAAEAGKNAAEQKVSDVEAFLKAEGDAAAEKAAADERRDTRLAEVAKLGVFKPEQLKDEARVAAWAAMDDEAWTAKVAELSEIASAHDIKPAADEVVEVPGKGKGDAPLGTAVTAAATEAGGDKPSAAVSVLRMDPALIRQTI